MPERDLALGRVDPARGPWIAEALDGANGGSFSAPAAVDAALQDLGLVFVLTSILLGEDRHGDIALGEGPDAPHLALHAGPTLGATLTF